MLAEGTHKVRLVGCFTGKSAEKETPYFGIEFETIKEEESINWIAYLTNTEFTRDNKTTTPAKENMKTLVKLGFVGRQLSDLSDDTKSISELFTPVENINIVVSHEEYTKEDGTTSTSAKVKFVNVGYGVNKMDHKQSIVIFKSLGFDGDLLKLQRELGVKRPEPKTAAPLQDEDVPF